MKITYQKEGYLLAFFAKPDFFVGTVAPYYKNSTGDDVFVDEDLDNQPIKIFHKSIAVDAPASKYRPRVFYNLYSNVYAVNGQCFATFDNSINYKYGTKMSIKQSVEVKNSNEDLELFWFKGPSLDTYGSFVVKRKEYDIEEGSPVSITSNIFVILDQVPNADPNRKSYKMGWYKSSSFVNNELVVVSDPVIFNSDTSYKTDCFAYRDVLTFEIKVDGLFQFYNFCVPQLYQASAISDVVLAFPADHNDQTQLHILKNREAKFVAQSFEVYVDESEVLQAEELQNSAIVTGSFSD
jgi:hypothetical protein